MLVQSKDIKYFLFSLSPKVIKMFRLKLLIIDTTKVKCNDNFMFVIEMFAKTLT